MMNKHLAVLTVLLLFQILVFGLPEAFQVAPFNVSIVKAYASSADSVHDVAIINAVPSSTETVKGDSITILADARNEGTESETFNVTAYYDGNIIIDAQTVISLEPNTSKTLTFMWNTTYVSFGNHNITVQASVVLGETDTSDNILAANTVKVIMGYPVASFTFSPTNPLTNETVTFDASLSNPKGGILINYMWNFGDGFYANGETVNHNYSQTGTYNISLTVTDSEEANNTGWQTITVSPHPIHNISIISVTPSTNTVFGGQPINITAVIQNNGNINETFNVTIYANTAIIQIQTVSNLTPSSQTTLTFIWNTKVPPGNYTIKAETSIDPEETYAAQTITVHTPLSWYNPLVSLLTGIPPYAWLGISIPIILIALFWLGIIKVEIEKAKDPAEELQDQINSLLQPLTEKDERFIPLQQFLNNLLKENPPPETIEFLQNTFPTIINTLTEPEEKN